MACHFWSVQDDNSTWSGCFRTLSILFEFRIWCSKIRSGVSPPSYSISYRSGQFDSIHLIISAPGIGRTLRLNRTALRISTASVINRIKFTFAVFDSDTVATFSSHSATSGCAGFGMCFQIVCNFMAGCSTIAFLHNINSTKWHTPFALPRGSTGPNISDTIPTVVSRGAIFRFICEATGISGNGPPINTTVIAFNKQDRTIGNFVWVHCNAAICRNKARGASRVVCMIIFGDMTMQ